MPPTVDHMNRLYMIPTQAKKRNQIPVSKDRASRPSITTVATATREAPRA